MIGHMHILSGNDRLVLEDESACMALKMTP